MLEIEVCSIVLILLLLRRRAKMQVVTIWQDWTDSWQIYNVIGLDLQRTNFRAICVEKIPSILFKSLVRDVHTERFALPYTQNDFVFKVMRIGSKWEGDCQKSHNPKSRIPIRRWVLALNTECMNTECMSCDDMNKKSKVSKWQHIKVFLLFFSVGNLEVIWENFQFVK